ncbi:MAG TPA: AMP-binding protein, partial [Amycolatopsis sp.]|nr:AMP-binding protein [Amycolatopsis sp.]
MTAILPRFPSILHALLAQAERGSDGSALTMILEPGQLESRRYDVVLEAATRGAAVLAEHGVSAGDRVLLCLPTSWSFATAFFGTQLLGAVPTAIAAPTGLGGAAAFGGQLKDLLAYLRPTAIVTTAAMIEAVGGFAGPALVDGDELDARATAGEAPMYPIHRPSADDLAFIQCT